MLICRRSPALLLNSRMEASMAGSRTPGPLCQVKNWFEDPIDEGTLARVRHHPPGPLCQVKYWFDDLIEEGPFADVPHGASGYFGVPAGRIPVAERVDPGVETLERIDKYGSPYLSRAQGRLFRLERRTADSFRALRAAAMAAGFDSELFTLTSDYRSSSKQAGLSARAIEQYGSRERARVFVATRSEHITGRAMDLNLGISNSGANALARKFDELPQYQWLKENAAQFGLNPYSYTDATHPGEPWHWSYNTR
jgi:hypothetical protein